MFKQNLHRENLGKNLEKNVGKNLVIERILRSMFATLLFFEKYFMQKCHLKKIRFYKYLCFLAFM